MRSRIRFIAMLAGAVVLVGACGSAGSTPSPAPVGPATTTPSVAPSPTAAPTPTVVPMTDGKGPEHFVGAVTSAPVVTVEYKQTIVGAVTQLRDGVVTLKIQTNDVRMGGTVTWSLNADMHGTVGPLWGQIEVQNSSGTWTGLCAAAGWGSIGQLVASGWLTGAGAYAGSTAYFSLNAADPSPLRAVVEGVIFEGPAPKG